MNRKWKTFSFRAIVALGSIFSALCVAQPVQAAILIWSGTAGATWDTSSNWWSGATAATPYDSTNGTGSIADFVNGGDTPSVGGSIYVNGIHFDNTATISGGTINLVGSAPAIQANAAGTINSVLTGTLGMVKAGTGTLTLGGVNTYSGATTVSAGNLQVPASGALANTTGLTVAGGTLSLTGGNVGGSALPTFTIGTTGASTVNISSGTLTATNAGSDHAYIGNGGAATWNQTGGAVALLGGANLYFGNNSAATMTISGGTFSKPAGSVFLGYNTAGSSLTINNANGGGFVNLDVVNVCWTGNNLGQTATLNLDGGTLEVNNMQWEGNSGDVGTIYFNGGTLVARTSFDLSAYNGSYTYFSTPVKEGGAVLNSNGNTFTVSSPLTHGGVAATDGGVTKIGGGTLVLGNVNNTYTGPTTISAGTLSAGLVNASGGASSIGNAASPLVLGDNAGHAGTLNYTGNTDTFSRGFTVNSGGGGINTATAGQTLTIDTGSITGSGPLSIGGDGNTTINNSIPAGMGALTKNGAGTLTLASTNGYSGGTTIAAGSLVLGATGTLGSGNVTVDPGALLDVSAYGSGYNFSGGVFTAGRNASPAADINGSLNLTNVTINPYNGGSGALTIAGGLSLSSGSISYDQGDLIAASGPVNLAGSESVVPNGAVAVGNTYTLFTGSSVPSNPGSFLSVAGGNPRSSYAFAASGGTAVTMSVTGYSASLSWMGGGNHTWDNGISTSWYNPTISAADKFYNGDNVTFNDTPGTATTVTISGSVRPASLTVSNTAVNYTFSGTGSIDNGTSLIENGPGALTIANSNSYAGGTNVNGGTLNANAIGALGTGAVTQSGGVLALNAAQSVSSLALSGGLLNINVPNALGVGALTISGGTIDSTAGGVTVNGNAQNWNGNFAFRGTQNLNLGNGAVTLGSGATTVTVSAGTLTAGGAIGDGGNGYALTKNGNGTLTLAAANTYSGATAIGGGTLLLANPAALGMSLLDYNNYGGALSFGTLTSATFGGLQGGQSLALNNTSAQGVALTVGVNNASTTYSGNLSDSSGGSLLKTGTGTLTLAGSNTYTSGTVIGNSTAAPGGTLALGANNALPVGGAVTIDNRYSSSALTSMLALGTFNQSIGNVTLYAGPGSRTAISSNGGTLVLSGSVTVADTHTGGQDYPLIIAAPIDLNGATRTLSVGWGNNNDAGDLGDLLLNGVISTSSGTAGLTIAPWSGNSNTSASVTLGSSNTYNGPTTLQGTMTLALNANNAIPNNSAFVQGAGTILDLTAWGASAGVSTGVGSLTGAGTINLGSAGVLTVGFDNSSPAAYSGTINGAGGSIVKTGSGTLTLSGNSTYTGGTTISAGTLSAGNINSSVNAYSNIGNSFLPIVLGDNGANTGTLNYTGNSDTYSNGFMINAGGGRINTTIAGQTLTIGTNDISGTGPLTIGGAGNTLVTSNIQTGITSLAKVDGGTLTLAGFSNGYTGPTTINGGALYLNTASNATTSISVGAGAVLGGAGSAPSATVAVAGSGTLDFSQNAGPTFAVAGLTFQGAAKVNVGNLASYASSPVINVTNSNGLTTSGSRSVIFELSGAAPVGSGSVQLIQYAGTIQGAGSTAFTVDPSGITGLGGRAMFTLTNPPGYIDLSYTIDHPVWSGALNGIWTTATQAAPKNWVLASNPGATTDFLTGDTVVFDDSAGVNTTVSISGSGNVNPGSVVFNNTAFGQSYLIQGTHGIAGSGNLAVGGGGAVTITNSNGYTGGTTLSNGLLNLANSAAIGSGPLMIGGGSLDNVGSGAMTLGGNIPQTWNGSFTFVGSNPLNLGTGAVAISGSPTVLVNASTLTAGGAISGAGALSKDGSGSLVLSGGGIVGGITILNGTLDLGGQTVSTAGVISFQGGTVQNGTLAQTGSANAFDAQNGTVSANLTGAVGLSATTAGSVTLSGSNTYSGATTVAGGGALKVTGGAIPNTTALTVTNYSTLALTGGNVGGNALNSFVVGTGGNTGEIDISGGTLTVNNSAVTSALNNGGAATWNQTGGLANFVDGNQLRVGLGAAATMTISGGTFSKPLGTVFLGYNQAGTSLTIDNAAGGGRVNLNELWICWTGNNLGTAATVNLNGGTLQVNNMQWQGNAGDYGVVDFNGGTFVAGASFALAANQYLTTQVDAGGAIINSNGNTLEIDSPLTSVIAADGGLTKLGAGTLILASTNTYNGGTFVVDGTLIATNSEAIADGTSLTVGNASYFAPVVPTHTAIAPVPEPGTFVLVVAGALVGIGFWRRKERRA